MSWKTNKPLKSYKKEKSITLREDREVKQVGEKGWIWEDGWIVVMEDWRDRYVVWQPSVCEFSVHSWPSVSDACIDSLSVHVHKYSHKATHTRNKTAQETGMAVFPLSWYAPGPGPGNSSLFLFLPWCSSPTNRFSMLLLSTCLF